MEHPGKVVTSEGDAEVAFGAKCRAKYFEALGKLPKHHLCRQLESSKTRRAVCHDGHHEEMGLGSALDQ